MVWKKGKKPGNSVFHRRVGKVRFCTDFVTQNPIFKI